MKWKTFSDAGRKYPEYTALAFVLFVVAPLLLLASAGCGRDAVGVADVIPTVVPEILPVKDVVTAEVPGNIPAVPAAPVRAEGPRKDALAVTVRQDHVTADQVALLFTGMSRVSREVDQLRLGIEEQQLMVDTGFLALNGLVKANVRLQERNRKLVVYLILFLALFMAPLSYLQWLRTLPARFRAWIHRLRQRATDRRISRQFAKIKRGNARATKAAAVDPVEQHIAPQHAEELETLAALADRSCVPDDKPEQPAFRGLDPGEPLLRKQAEQEAAVSPPADGTIGLDDLRPSDGGSKAAAKGVYTFSHTDDNGGTREYGPYPIDELKRLVEAGLVMGGTLLCDEKGNSRRALNFPPLQSALLATGRDSDA